MTFNDNINDNENLSEIKKRLRGEPVRFGKRIREPIRFGKRLSLSVPLRMLSLKDFLYRQNII